MKKQKLNLGALKVSSFPTGKENEIKGGVDTIGCPPTPATFCFHCPPTETQQ